MAIKYGPPNIQPGDMPYSAYGSPLPSRRVLTVLFSLITTPLVVVVSFVVGSILYLLTHKKIFIIIPLILALLYLARYLAETIFGISVLL